MVKPGGTGSPKLRHFGEIGALTAEEVALTTRPFGCAAAETRRPISSCFPGAPMTAWRFNTTTLENHTAWRVLRSEKVQTDRRRRPKNIQLAPLNRSSIPSNMPMMKRLLPGPAAHDHETQDRRDDTRKDQRSAHLRVMQSEPGPPRERRRGQQPCTDQQRQNGRGLHGFRARRRPRPPHR